MPIKLDCTRPLKAGEVVDLTKQIDINKKYFPKGQDIKPCKGKLYIKTQLRPIYPSGDEVPKKQITVGYNPTVICFFGEYGNQETMEG